MEVQKCHCMEKVKPKHSGICAEMKNALTKRFNWNIEIMAANPERKKK